MGLEQRGVNYSSDIQHWTMHRHTSTGVCQPNSAFVFILIQIFFWTTKKSSWINSRYLLKHSVTWVECLKNQQVKSLTREWWKRGVSLSDELSFHFPKWLNDVDIFLTHSMTFVENGILFILENFKSCACTVGEILSTGDHAKPKNGLDE